MAQRNASAFDPDAATMERERLAAIVSASDDAIVGKDLDGIIQTWNASAERIFGYSAKEAIGQHISLIIPEHLLREEDYIIGELRAGRRVSHFETVRRRKDGAMIDVSLSVSPIPGPDGRVVGAAKVARDITEQKQHQRQLKELNANLEEMVRTRTKALERTMREVDAFNHAVAHDLRTPLRAILGFSRLLLNSPNLTPEERENLRFIKESSEQMARITKALLNLSQIRAERINRVPVDLSDVARKTVERLYTAFPGQNVQVKVASGLKAEADRDQTEIVLQNLLSNAWKFTANRRDPVVEVGAAVKEGQRMFFVRDNGIGFRPQDGPKILGGFRRLRPDEFEGSGIGLTTVSRIVNAHGGRIIAEGIPGEGATIWFSLKPEPSEDASRS